MNTRRRIAVIVTAATLAGSLSASLPAVADQGAGPHTPEACPRRSPLSRTITGQPRSPPATSTPTARSGCPRRSLLAAEALPPRGGAGTTTTVARLASGSTTSRPASTSKEAASTKSAMAGSRLSQGTPIGLARESGSSSRQRARRTPLMSWQRAPKGLHEASCTPGDARLQTAL